jgi:hypothetical protein
VGGEIVASGAWLMWRTHRRPLPGRVIRTFQYPVLKSKLTPIRDTKPIGGQ